MYIYSYLQRIRIILFFCGCLFFILSGKLYSYDYQYYFDKYEVEIEESPHIDLTFPIRAQPNLSQDITDLSYRVHEVLPFEEDKKADMYLVYPLHGIVVPILQPTQDDRERIRTNEPFNHFTYLERWALHYYGNSPDKQSGNMVVAAHSSFKKEDSGRYKTIFQALPISRAGEHIFVYIKNDTWTYDLYDYIIEVSFETDKYNVSILEAENDDDYTLTTYGCYTIWTSEDRRVNKAYLQKKWNNHSSLQEHTAAPEKESRKEIQKQSEIKNWEHMSPDISVKTTHIAQPHIITRLLIEQQISSIYVSLLKQLKFQPAIIHRFIELIDEKIHSLNQGSSPNLEKIYMFTYLKQKLEADYSRK